MSVFKNTLNGLDIAHRKLLKEKLPLDAIGARSSPNTTGTTAVARGSRCVFGSPEAFCVKFLYHSDSAARLKVADGDVVMAEVQESRPRHTQEPHAWECYPTEEVVELRTNSENPPGTRKESHGSILGVERWDGET